MAENVFAELGKVIDLIGKEKGIDRSIVIDSVIQALETAARKKFGSYREFEATYNEATGEVELFEFKEVVEPEKFVDEEVEIPLAEARKLDPEAQVGDMIGIKMEAHELGRIAAQTARQVISQRVREAESDVIVSEFEKRKGEIASGIVRRFEKDTVVVDLGRTEAYMPKREQIPGEVFKAGDRLQGYISEVRQSPRGPQIIISRADERYLIKLFENEVPEIQDGTIQIMSAARDPGLRAKIAVRSLEPNVDPVGSCVGMKGSRVQNVIQELKGEKIDIVVYDEDITRYVANALQPARISRIFLDEDNRALEVIVADDQLSLAIGRKGQNVRLASKLTGWKIDVTSESMAKAKQGDAVFNLMLIPQMTEEMAVLLFQYGFSNLKELLQLHRRSWLVFRELRRWSRLKS
ncbi:MAG: transcription termination factor NusA [Bdellovibrionaceae bacterium]|nr:transcription termination factor NusA [Pseudobdellovibrionaceae bacterium]